MTKDEALTMIIASIAMEELALSHIVNAEGEKLQYVLGTLPGGRRPCAAPQEILEVNRSVKDLLDTVMQSQLLLKGKLEKALEAGGCPVPPCPPEPPCGPACPKPPCPPEPPCGPACPKPPWPPEPPCGPACPEPPCPPEPPCGPACPEPPCPPERPACRPPRPEMPSSGEDGPCCEKSAIQLESRCHGFFWEDGALLSWKCQGVKGRSIRWSEKTPSLVRLEPERAYMLHYAINVRGPYHKSDGGSVRVKLTPCNAFAGFLPLCFSLKDRDCAPLTLQYSAILFPQACPTAWADLGLRLHCREGLFVDQAVLSAVEL